MIYTPCYLCTLGALLSDKSAERARKIRSQILFSPTLKKFRDPGSAFRQRAQHCLCLSNLALSRNDKSLEQPQGCSSRVGCGESEEDPVRRSNFAVAKFAARPWLAAESADSATLRLSNLASTVRRHCAFSAHKKITPVGRIFKMRRVVDDVRTYRESDGGVWVPSC